MTDKQRKLEQQKADNIQKANERENASNKSFVGKVSRSAKGMSVMKLVLTILIVSALFAVLTNRPVKTFASFLQQLQTAPQIPIANLVSFVEKFPTIGGNWYVLEPIKDFINLLIGLIGDIYTVGMYIVFSIYNCLLYIIWALKWLLL